MSCGCCSPHQCTILLFIIGALCTGIGIVLIIIWPGVAESIINNKLPLGPESWSLKHWLNPPINIYMFVYFFNWTNMYEASNPNVKPNFVQCGPYVFRNEKTKEDIIWHDNDTMTFYGRRTWFFEQNMSIGSLEDLIILPHPPSVVLANRVRNWNRYMKKIMNYFLKTEGGLLAVNKTVDEWLFKGFYDPLAEFAMLLESKLIPWHYKNFGFFLGRNGSKEYEGTYTIQTGQKDLSMLGELSHWRGSNESYAYDGECGRVNGSTGDIFAPARGPDETISIFLSDACRAINIFPGERKQVRGIDTIKYSANSMSFDSGEMYPNMKCFCSKKSKSCAHSGALDLRPCKHGASFYLSQPHFLDADPSYRDSVSGMNPNPEEHGFYLLVEPTLGVPVKVNASLQISLPLKGDELIEIFKNVNEFYAPLFIISERGDLNESMAKLVRLALKAPAIGQGCAAGLLAIGIIILTVATYRYYIMKKKATKR